MINVPVLPSQQKAVKDAHMALPDSLSDLAELNKRLLATSPTPP